MIFAAAAVILVFFASAAAFVSAFSLAFFFVAEVEQPLDAFANRAMKCFEQLLLDLRDVTTLFKVEIALKQKGNHRRGGTNRYAQHIVKWRRFGGEQAPEGPQA